jgi:hypothetical protein
MADGADKLIDYRVRGKAPGGLGLVDRSAKLLIRFDETSTATRPQDETGACEDFDVLETPVATAMPISAVSALGRGRTFNAATMGLGARDKDPGATLLTRDVTIQVVLSWDAASQSAAGIPGTIISRGVGGSSAEYVSYGLRIDVVDAPTFVGLIRWYWQDVAGAEKLQDGAEVCIPPGQYTMLTATRRWVSPTQVELVYYVGDRLLAAVTSADGSIGGGTTGLVQIGCRTVAGVNGAFYAGTLDELMVLDHEICLEEIEATWLRMVKYQPYATQLFRDQFDEGFPLAGEPDSDQALDIRMTGHALGLAASNVENLRANFLPQRAYGSTLEQWEEATAVTPKPGATGSIEERRGRVLARLRQKQGVSIPGLKEALRDVIDGDPDDLEFISYSNMIRDGFDTAIEPQLWDQTPTGSAAWSSGRARFAPGAGTFTFSGRSGWKTIARSVSQPSVQGTVSLAQTIAKLLMTTPQNNFEAGVWVGDKGLHNYLLLGLRDVAGVFKFVTEAFLLGISQGVTIQATPGANPAASWLHLHEDSEASWVASWSTTSETAGYASSAPIAFPTLVHWAGCYIRSTGAVGAGPVADFDDFQLFTPNGTRPFNAYVFRDPGLGGTPDVEGANSVIRSIKHGFTHAAFVTSRAVLSADLTTPCDRGPMGVL